MPNIPVYKAGVLGVNKDIPPEEQHPLEWSDMRGSKMLDGKAVRGFGDSDVFGTTLGPPYWNMPIQAGSIAVWAYSSIGSIGNDAFTKILLHMDGVDAATTFTDTASGAGAHVWTAAGNAQLDTAQSQFGGCSGLFDGTGDWVSTPDSADFTLGAGDWTIECWIKSNSNGTTEYFWGQSDAAATVATISTRINRGAGGVISAQVYVGGVPIAVNGTTVITNLVNTGWHHVALVRFGNILNLFVDGVKEGGDVALVGTVQDSANNFRVGAPGEVTSNTWTGWIDEFRLSVGIARYTANFTPPVAQFGTVSEANLFATDGATHAVVTRTVAGLSVPYTVDSKNLWHGGTLSQIPIITNGIDKPQMWLNPSLATDFADLTNWPAADRCELIKPFKQFMVSMVILRGGVTYKHLVKWSHPAVPGAVPSSWDETDPTKLAGEVEILDELPGGIRDGLGLRDTFVIYKDNSTWGMQFIGGNNVFRFFPIFLSSGILSRHCVSSLNNGSQHFVATGDDFIIHDGQNAKSVLDKRMKSWIANNIPDALADYCFTVSKAASKEVWFCFPPASGQFPTMAAVYNWQDDTCVIRDFANPISHADIGPIAASSDPWDADTADWASDATAWDLSLFSPHFLQLVGSVPGNSTLRQLDDEINYASGYLERTGLALIGSDRVSGQLKADNEAMKLVSRIWPKATGTAFFVQLGAQEFNNTPVVYEPQQLFTPGIDKYLDFSPVNGRFIALKYTWQGSGATEISGYNMLLEVLGDQ